MGVVQIVFLLLLPLICPFYSKSITESHVALPEYYFILAAHLKPRILHYILGTTFEIDMLAKVLTEEGNEYYEKVWKSWD